MAARKSPAPPAKRRPKTDEPRDPAALIAIRIVPPHVVAGSDAAVADARLDEPELRPGTVALSRLPWLRQDRALRVGYHVMTEGLTEHAGHRELEVCNVPAFFIEATVQLLHTIADGILNNGVRLRHNQTMSLAHPDDELSALLSFRRIRPGEHGSQHDAELLRVLFLR
jgi:hypothetical protein